MPEDTVEGTVVEEIPANSRKREVTAAVTATVVSIVLAGVASVLIDRIHNHVKQSIAPENENE